jgi:PhoH-like ATPase
LIKKHVIFDTSVVINDPICLFNLSSDTLGIVPATVIEELNTLKSDTDRLRGSTAQKVLHYLDELTENNPELVTTGMPLETGGVLLVEMNHTSFEHFKDNFSEKTEDNTIIAVAKNYLEEHKSSGSDIEVILYSNDYGMRVKARSLGINAKSYDADNLINTLDEVYKGYFETFVSPDIINQFYKNKIIDLSELNLELDREPYINEFIILIDEFNVKNKKVGRVKIESKTGRKMLHKLFVSEDLYLYGIRALDTYQLMTLELLLDDTVPFVSIIGKAGTGKTLLALAVGLHKLKTEKDENKKYAKILALRALVEVGNKKLGFLPGDLKEKLNPYMQPYFDNLEFLFHVKGNPEKLSSILEGLEGEFVVESTGFMRGRTLPNQFIIVDEAQNLTKHEVRTLITRVGENGKLVLIGDPSQIDDPYLDSVNNGLIYATERLKEFDLTGTVLLTGKSKRSALAELASNVL